MYVSGLLTLLGGVVMVGGVIIMGSRFGDKYGDRICLIGNIDCGATLSWGTEEEVRQEVKECIKKAGAGGGLICASSNSIHSGVKPENYLAMVKAIREYGRYPLSL